jgi:virulence-associated protein VagC
MVRVEEETPQRAKLFWNGRSQAVRLPRAFRFEGDEVLIRKEGDAVVLEPVGRKKWPPRYWAWVRRNSDALEIGDVEPLVVDLQDPEEE